MAHSFRVHYYHLIWSTKNRIPWIDKNLQERLYPYLAGITKNHNAKIIQIGGMPDHVHLLIEYKAIEKLHDFMRKIKSDSTKWIHRSFSEKQDFSWQRGYASFTVSFSGIEKVRKYIQNQESHHAKVSFEDEFKLFLKLHQVEYDEDSSLDRLWHPSRVHPYNSFVTPRSISFRVGLSHFHCYRNFYRKRKFIVPFHVKFRQGV